MGATAYSIQDTGYRIQDTGTGSQNPPTFSLWRIQQGTGRGRGNRESIEHTANGIQKQGEQRANSIQERGAGTGNMNFLDFYFYPPQPLA